jgi:hypothetical protein
LNKAWTINCVHHQVEFLRPDSGIGVTRYIVELMSKNSLAHFLSIQCQISSISTPFQFLFYQFFWQTETISFPGRVSAEHPCSERRVHIKEHFLLSITLQKCNPEVKIKYLIHWFIAKNIKYIIKKNVIQEEWGVQLYMSKEENARVTCLSLTLSFKSREIRGAPLHSVTEP